MSVIGTVHRFMYAAATAGLLALLVSGCGGTTPIPCVQGTAGCAATNGSMVNAFVSTPPSSTRGVCTSNPSSGGAHPRWTVLVYMNSANNLEPYSFLNVGQMASVGSDSNVNIVLQWKQADPSEIQNTTLGVSYTPSFIGTHRYFIKAHNATDVANIENGITTSLEDSSERLPDPSTNVPDYYPGTQNPVSALNSLTVQATTSDMGSYKTLQNFVQWGVANYPSDNLAVVIWDHGSGWLNVYRPNVVVPLSRSRAVSQDDDTDDEIETWELSLALGASTTNGKKIDDLVFDCSLQQMIEIEYQISTTNNAKVMVGSEESPPATGYPYDKWLLDLKASGKNPCDLATSIVTEFANDYTGQTKITQSYIDLTQMGATASALNAFGASCYTHRSDQGLVLATARTNAVAYGQEAGNFLYDGFIDLYNYADLISSSTTKSDLATAANNLKAAISNSTTGAVLQYGRGSSDEANSHGMSVFVYIPNDPNTGGAVFPSTYSDLMLSTVAPQWTQFIENQTQ